MGIRGKTYICYAVCCIYYVGIDFVMFWTYVIWPEAIGDGYTARFRVLLVNISALAVCGFAMHSLINSRAEYASDILKARLSRYVRNGAFLRRLLGRLSLFYKLYKHENLNAIHAKITKTYRFYYLFLGSIFVYGIPVIIWSSLGDAKAFLSKGVIHEHFFYSLIMPLCVCQLMECKYISDQDKSAWEKAWKEIPESRQKSGAVS